MRLSCDYLREIILAWQPVCEWETRYMQLKVGRRRETSTTLFGASITTHCSMMVNTLLLIFLFTLLVDTASSGCTFPNRLIGKWITEHDKGYDVITVNSTHMSGFSVGVITNLDFSCFIYDGEETYAMRSSQDQNLLGLKVNIYICWHIISVSYDEFSVKELAHRVSQNSDEKGVAFLPEGSPELSDICEQENKSDKPRILYRRH